MPEKNEDKWDRPVVRITIFLKGTLKNKVKHDIQVRGYSETDLGNEILKKHYENKDSNNRF